MSTAAELNPYPVSVPDTSHNLVIPASVKNRSIQQPKLTGKDDECYTRMLDKVSCLWADCEDSPYLEVINAILKRWSESGPSDKKFFEKAVDLFSEFQNRPMKSVKDSWEWLEYLKKSGIDLFRYTAWVDEQYELLAREKRKGFENITLERFSRSLITADWKDANDDSAIVNLYLLNTKASLKPEIYLGPLGKSRLAVRVNSECLRPPKADSHTAKSYGVTDIFPDILLDMSYVPLVPGLAKQTMLFIPIGNVFRMPRSHHILNTRKFEEGDWQETGIYLVLEIQRMDGKPNRLYMVKGLRSSNPIIDKYDEALFKGLETDSFTLAEVEKKTHLDLKPYDGITERPTLQLKRLSNSKLRIVQTGEKGDWSEGVPPIGLYPIDLDLDTPPVGRELSIETRIS